MYAFTVRNGYFSPNRLQHEIDLRAHGVKLKLAFLARTGFQESLAIEPAVVRDLRHRLRIGRARRPARHHSQEREAGGPRLEIGSPSFLAAWAQINKDRSTLRSSRESGDEGNKLRRWCVCPRIPACAGMSGRSAHCPPTAAPLARSRRRVEWSLDRISGDWSWIRSCASRSRRIPIRSKPRLVAPPGSWDTHFHVYAPHLFPFAEKRRYTPPAAPVEHYLQINSALGLERGVIVQPSVHGTNTAVTMHAVANSNGRLVGMIRCDPQPHGGGDRQAACRRHPRPAVSDLAPSRRFAQRGCLSSQHRADGARRLGRRHAGRRRGDGREGRHDQALQAAGHHRHLGPDRSAQRAG